jgi:hypothetical protein
MRQKSLGSWALTACSFFLTAPLAMAATPGEICDIAAQQAAKDSSVPLSVLKSIARVESGQTRDGKFSPWPWTINYDGKGYFFETQNEALNFSNNLLQQGILKFDVGCFQINLRWHAKNFLSIENAFDPTANAAYAARFLQQLYQQHGTWEVAVASYHSRTEVYANAYLKKVKAAWENLHSNQSVVTQPMQDASVETRVNTYPLLQPSALTETQAAPLSRGSLMPMSAPLVQFSLP